MPILRRCLIVDDNVDFREEARGLLEEQGLVVVATAGSTAEALQCAAGSSLDVALVDIDLGGESGLDLARHLHERLESPPAIILISTHDETEYADLIVACPAVGFLAKTALSVDAIDELLASGAGEKVSG